MKNIAINGLGRIGRMVLRHYLIDAPDTVQIVAANDLTPIDELAYLIRYDSVHRGATFPIKIGSDYMTLGSHKITIVSEKDPTALPWKKLDIDIDADIGTYMNIITLYDQRPIRKRRPDRSLRRQ